MLGWERETRERCLSSPQAGETEVSQEGWLQWSSRVHIFAFDCPPPHHMHKHRHSSRSSIWNINLIKIRLHFVLSSKRCSFVWYFSPSTPLLRWDKNGETGDFGGIFTLYIWMWISLHYVGHMLYIQIPNTYAIWYTILGYGMKRNSNMKLYLCCIYNLSVYFSL